MPRPITDRFTASISQSNTGQTGILVANSASLNPTDFVCVECRFKPIAGYNMVLFDNSTSGVTNSYFLSVDGLGNLNWFSTIGGVGKNIIGTSVKAMRNAWNLVSAFYTGSSIQICLNGSLVSTLAASGTLGTNSGQLRIGQYYNSAVTTCGLLTTPRVYHRVYSLADHQDRYYRNRDDATARSGLVLSFPMTEGALTSIADDSGNGNNGTYSNSIWSRDVPYLERPCYPSFAQVLYTNGSSDRVDLGNAGAICASVTAFSAACWFKREKPNALVAMMGDTNNAAQNHWNFQTNGSTSGVRKLLTTIITNIGPKALVGNNYIPLHQWCHAGLSYDGSFIRFYFMGVIDNMTTHTGTVLASTSGMNLATGSAPVGGTFRYYGGKLANEQYWDRTLSASEFYDLCYRGKNDSALRTNLQGEWNLSGNVNDTSGNANHGILTGGSYTSVDVPFKDRALADVRALGSARALAT